MNFPITPLAKEEFPRLLLEIPQPPEKLTCRGSLPVPDMKLLAVVGSRRYTDYGKQVVSHLISGLRGYNVGIVSGLALGIDSLAHKAALNSDLYTLAVPGGGLDDSVLYPSAHKPLARSILEHNGGLLSEYDPTFKATPWSFPQRNRIVCGMCQATLIIEAEEKSGTLITARMTIDYNRELLVVPGSIFSSNSVGSHQFLKLGAIPVTSAADILHALGIDPEVKEAVAKQTVNLSPLEEQILGLLHQPTAKDLLIRQLSVTTADASIILMEMEMNSLIVESAGIYRKA